MAARDGTGPGRTLRDLHRARLLQWRGSMNLVGPGDVDEHFQDCERALAGLRPVGRWADLGSGAGFPGLVMVAAGPPELSVDLVESRAKRAAFLQRVLTEAHVPPDRARVLRARVEDLPSDTWDGVVARAFAPPADVLAHAERLLVPDGRVVLFLQEGAAVAGLEALAGDRFTVEHVEHYHVGGKARASATLRRRPDPVVPPL